MLKGLLGKKIGILQVVDEARCLVPVTVIEVGPCGIVQIKEKGRDGYTILDSAFLTGARTNLESTGFSVNAPNRLGNSWESAASRGQRYRVACQRARNLKRRSEQAAARLTHGREGFRQDFIEFLLESLVVLDL